MVTTGMTMKQVERLLGPPADQVSLSDMMAPGQFAVVNSRPAPHGLLSRLRARLGGTTVGPSPALPDIQGWRYDDTPGRGMTTMILFTRGRVTDVREEHRGG